MNLTMIKGMIVKHAPTILLASGVAGTISAVVLACRASVDLHYRLDVAKDNIEADPNNRAVRVKEVCKVIQPYVFPAALCATSIGVIIASNRILAARNAALTAAYTALETAFNKYRDNVKMEYGEEKERDIYEKSLADVARIHDLRVFGRFFDETNRNYQRSAAFNKVFLTAQENYMNDLLYARGHLFLNDVYDALGMERSKAGAVIGWAVGEGFNNHVSFGIYNTETERGRAFVNEDEASIFLVFNVDGCILDYIDRGVTKKRLPLQLHKALEEEE